MEPAAKRQRRIPAQGRAKPLPAWVARSAAPKRPKKSSNSRWSLARKPLVVLGGVIVVAAGTAAGTWLTNAPSQISQAVADAGSPLVASANIVQEPDQGNSMAAPDGYVPSSRVLSEMSQPNDPTSMQFFQDVAAGGGVGLQDLSVELFLAGNNSQGVDITNIQLASLRRQSPLSGTLFFIPPQEANPTLSLMFNLDEANPIARQLSSPAAPNPLPAGPYFDGDTISLAKGEKQTFYIRFETARFYATFDLEIDYTVGNDIGDEKKLIIGDGAKQFGVTGLHLGPQRGTISYEHAYEVNNSDPFALCEAEDPNVIPLQGAYPNPGPCVSSK